MIYTEREKYASNKSGKKLAATSRPHMIFFEYTRGETTEIIEISRRFVSLSFQRAYGFTASRLSEQPGKNLLERRVRDDRQCALRAGTPERKSKQTSRSRFAEHLESPSAIASAAVSAAMRQQAVEALPGERFRG